LYVFNYQSEASILGVNFFRNQSLFWEPGILAIFMNLFLLLCFVRKSFGFWFYSSAFIVLTTFSSTGIVLLVVQLFYFLYKGRSSYLMKLLGILSVIVVILYFLVPNLAEKTSGSGVASFDLRTFDLLNALSIVTNHPARGIGLDPDVYLKLYDVYQTPEFTFTYNDYNEARGNTNSFLMILVSLGIFLGALFYYQFFNRFRFRQFSLIFYLIISVSVLSEPLMLSNLFLISPLNSFYFRFYL
jgi:hypothetical protein